MQLAFRDIVSGLELEALERTAGRGASIVVAPETVGLSTGGGKS